VHTDVANNGLLTNKSWLQRKIAAVKCYTHWHSYWFYNYLSVQLNSSVFINRLINL